MFGTTQMLVAGSVAKHAPTPTSPEERLGLENMEKTSRRVAEIRPLARGNRGLLRTCLDTLLKFNMETWKWHPGIGDFLWKPSFLGSMLNLGRVIFKEVTADQVSNVGSFLLETFFFSCHHFWLSSLLGYLPWNKAENIRCANVQKKTRWT